MSFLNKYNKDPHLYSDSKQIDDAIYSVGAFHEYVANRTSEEEKYNDELTFDSEAKKMKFAMRIATQNQGLITKTDLNGNLIWEKKYSISQERTVSFHKIIACENGDLLVLASSNISGGKRSWELFRIDSNGNTIWIKSYNSTVNSTSGQAFLTKLEGENYILVIPYIYSSSGSGEITRIDNHIIKINSSGTILKERTLFDNDKAISIRTLSSKDNQILLGANQFNDNSGLLGLVFILDNDLNLINKFGLKSTINNPADSIFLENINFINNQLIFSGVLNFDTLFSTYIAKIALPNNPQSGNLTIKLTPNFTGNFVFNQDFIYPYELSNTILKLDYNLNLIWSKQLSDTYSLDIKECTSNHLIYHDKYNYFIGKSNLDFESCKTVSVELDPITNLTLLYTSDFKYIIENSNAISVTQASYSNINITSIKVEICPTIIEGPCIKDEKICADYNELLQSFTKCIEEIKSKNPDYIKKLSVFKDCFKKFLEAFNQIDKNYPQLKLAEFLQFQIKAIKVYIEYEGDKGIGKYYYDALSAVQFILEYLSQLGNCNCENVLDLTDYSSIQSGHLYLQSAGSIGEDSSKGIHLRWALREALSNHLPKANYATTTHNFNKSDDFVKIYRAKYTPYKTTLDFNNVPLQINENGSQKNWIYEVDEKVFHVHFRNNIKYNQVRAIINPADNPLGFIKNYGDALLEIETKTELSFKISPKFEILNSSNSIKTELLSVSENKITSPKAASLRKKYAAEELNEKPLLSENIRSIRFSSNNAHIILLSFEFYSDCIINTKKENNWKFLGKYALTKEANVAFQRLEPEADCLKKWLRYNDQAFVNVANYHTRWNSTNLPALERISTSVDKYIALSDAFNNPRALEIFPFEDYSDVEACNLTYPDYDPENPEYDPYIPETPTEATGIEIPYLDVLQLGSLDYHVARMLGLGTLDLNPLVFEGEYIYLSEYVTFGNLQDGLGARQVQHLYCSLPTSLSDQRL